MIKKVVFLGMIIASITVSETAVAYEFFSPPQTLLCQQTSGGFVSCPFFELIF